MKRVVALALCLGLVAAVAAPVAAGVDRHQIVTNEYTLVVNNNPGYNHYYTVVMNPCDGSVDITGYTWSTETVTGSWASGSITFDSTYDANGYQWGGTFPVAGGVFSDFYGPSVTSAEAVLTNSTSTDYKNHGQYVKAMGGGADAAHSCIGMPVKARP